MVLPPSVNRHIKECRICGKKIRPYQSKPPMDDIVKRETINGIEIVYFQTYHLKCAEDKLRDGN